MFAASMAASSGRRRGHWRIAGITCPRGQRRPTTSEEDLIGSPNCRPRSSAGQCSLRRRSGVVLVWMPLILVFESIHTWQLVVNTVTSVVAFLLIALLQNTERRGTRALHGKLDALAGALAESMACQDDERLKDGISHLRAVVKLEKQI